MMDIEDLREMFLTGSVTQRKHEPAYSIRGSAVGSYVKWPEPSGWRRDKGYPKDGTYFLAIMDLDFMSYLFSVDMGIPYLARYCLAGDDHRPIRPIVCDYSSDRADYEDICIEGREQEASIIAWMPIPEFKE
jgi:hypothetical protein